MTRTLFEVIESCRSFWMSSPQRPFTSMGTRSAPWPVICSTAETSPFAKSAWPATMARLASSLIVFTQVLVDCRLVAHLLDQRLVEPLGRIDTAPLEKMVHGNDLGDDGDVLSRIERHGDLRDGDADDIPVLAAKGFA